jgi:hypothetical protein
VVVAGSLIAGLFLYSSLPGTISTSQSSIGSSSASSGLARYPFGNPGYLISPSPCAASYRSNGTAYAEPCAFGGTVSDAMVFSCTAEAALPSGCTGQISGMPNTTPAPPAINGSNRPGTVPVLNNTITVWYPYVNQTSNRPSWANCMFQVGHLQPGSQYGFCFPINSTSFVVSGPAFVAPPEG